MLAFLSGNRAALTIVTRRITILASMTPRERRRAIHSRNCAIFREGAAPWLRWSGCGRSAAEKADNRAGCWLRINAEIAETAEK